MNMQEMDELVLQLVNIIEKKSLNRKEELEVCKHLRGCFK